MWCKTFLVLLQIWLQIACSGVFAKERTGQTDQRQSANNGAVFEPFVLETDRLGERVCLYDDNQRSYYCATRKHQLQKEKDSGKKYSLGVAQRIDGSDKEKEAIREVIGLMNDYFLNEVLIKPAYKDIRHKWCVFSIDFYLPALEYLST